MLLQHGYNTYMVGKWHLMPSEQESAAGPYDRWPLGRGFERFYGFLGGDTSQWYPDLVYDNHQVEPPRDARGGLPPDRGPGRQGDRVHRRRQAGRPGQAVLPALLHRRDARPAPRAEGVGRPLPGAVRRRLGRLPRAGLRPAEGAGRRAGRRRAVPARPRRAGVGVAVAGRPPARRPDDGGLRRVPVPHRPPHRPAARLPAGDRRARQHADHGGLRQRRQRRGRGRPAPRTRRSSSTTRPEPLEDSLARIDELGGPTTFNHYPWGWTWAGNTPFRRWKRETYRGGASDPFLVHWPAGIKARGEVRDQYAHIIDMVPTVLDALGLEPPATIRGVTQSPIHGVSFAHTFDDAGRADPPPHPVLRDVRPPRDRPRRLAGGLPVARALVRRGRPARSARRSPAETLADLDANRWELYHVAEDFAENHDLADEHRGQAHRADRASGTSRPASTTCCRSTAAPCSG